MVGAVEDSGTVREREEVALKTWGEWSFSRPASRKTNMDESKHDVVVDAAGAALHPNFIDVAIARLRFLRFLLPSQEIVIRSHPVQIRMYEAAGCALVERHNRRETANGIRWQMDGRLPPDELMLEAADVNGVIKRLSLA